MPEPDEVISRYSDENALEDGVLVAVSKRDRVTVGVFAFLGEAAPENDGPPPSRWSVPLLEWCRAKTADTKAAALANGFIEAHRGHAQRADEAGDFLVAYLITTNGKLSGFALDETNRKLGRPRNTPREDPPESPAGDPWRKVWLVPNELHGLTLMFPDEY